jgi:hypothetical protein
LIGRKAEELHYADDGRRCVLGLRERKTESTGLVHT